MTFNVIIIDDEQPARKLIENYVAKIDFLELLGTFKCALGAIPVLKREQVDIMFLDIRMPEISGLDFLETLDKTPEVILTTAYREYALEGYEFDVLDYLLKPIEFSRFLKAINKVENKFRSVPLPYNVIPEEIKYIYLKQKSKQIKVALSDVLFIKAENEYVDYYLKNKQKILILGALKNLEEELQDSNFIRIHRSYIVNLDAIEYIEGNQISVGNHKIPVSETYKKTLFSKWGN